MLGVAALPAIEVGAVVRVPAMARMMDSDVPKIAEHQPGCETTRLQKADWPPKGKKPAEAQHRQGHPNRSPDRSQRVCMMGIVHLLEPRYVM